MSIKEITPWFKQVFQLIDETCHAMDIPLYLIGAQARHFHIRRIDKTFFNNFR